MHPVNTGNGRPFPPLLESATAFQMKIIKLGWSWRSVYAVVAKR